MNFRGLRLSQVNGILLGLIITIILLEFRIPPAFALVVGIIFGYVAVVVLGENEQQGGTPSDSSAGLK